MIVKNVLAVGSHPDDIEMGCGGALTKHIENGDRVFALILTHGEKGRHSCDMSECVHSLNRLGVKNIFFGNFRDGFVSANFDTINFIESFIRKYKIDRVYTHDPHDRHQDHRNCSMAVLSASRKVGEIFLYQGPSTNVYFQPHYYIELSKKQVVKKIKALSSYRTQIAKGIVNLPWIQSLAGFHGLGSNAKYAEAFALNHLVKTGKNV